MDDLHKKATLAISWILKHTVFILADVAILILTLFLFFFLYAYFKTPIAATLYTRPVPLTTIIYDRTGEHVLYKIHGEENRKTISHEEIPDVVRIATIAAEDDNFYNHHGIDLLSVFRALTKDIQSNSAQQGASTITQQLARNAFLSQDKTLRRKFLEAIMAIKIEKKFNKDQILDMYLNEIPYGSNAYGIQAAAETFFGKDAKDLTLDEAAFLAALPKATTYYSPYGNHRNELIQRQQYILDRIAELKLASGGIVSMAKGENAIGKIIASRQAIEAPHFVFYVREYMEKKYGKEMVEEGGFKIYTTLDYDLQKLAEKTVQEGVKNNTRYNASNAALVSLDPQTGQILAMVGSRNYFDQSIDGQVNVSTRPRQPGSSFKPFAYATAFEKGYQPETMILDARTNFGPDGSGKNYIPSNYDGKFHGLVSMRQALSMSLNVPAVKTLYLAGVDNTIDMAHRLGITTLNEKGRYGLALVLGGGEVTLLDETSGFSVFANDGKRNPATGILKIVDSAGKVYETAKAENMEVLDPQIARKINSILSDNAARVPIFGPNNKLFIPGKFVAAKTGTTQEFRDAWTIGYTPYIATGVWVGNNDNRAMRAGADGSYVAAPIWNSFMRQVLDRYPNENFIAYDKVENKNLKETVRISYYKKKNGKEISAEKAKDMDPDKVEIRIESLPEEFIANNQQNQASLDSNATPAPVDPMILRWRESLKESSDIKSYLETIKK